MEFREITAKTVDEAITKACLEFGISSDNLEIEVVREGTSGFFGIGSKPAIIRVRRKAEEEEFSILEELKKEEQKKEAVRKEPKKEPRKDIKKEPKKEPKKENKEPRKEAVKEPKKEVKKDASKPPKKENNKPAEKEAVKEPVVKEPAVKEPAVKEAPVKKETKQEVKKEEKKTVVRTDEQVAAMKRDAEKFLAGVFKAMELPVNIQIVYDKENDSLDINFDGEDMGILIGKRGQTLDSLQYLTSLVVNKEQENYVRVKLDTEDYRSRRKDTLEKASGVSLNSYIILKQIIC